MPKSKELKRLEAQERKREMLLTHHLPALFEVLPGGERYDPTHEYYYRMVNDRARNVLKIARESKTDIDFAHYWNGKIDQMGTRSYIRIAFQGTSGEYYIRSFNKYMSIHYPSFKPVAVPHYMAPRVDEAFLANIED
ncbi:hypothetical protein AVT69_gp337 [Pseudomonas phage PhiPA3]|uniref:Uncharacterized protein 339 n=1 Tax=Pseudomonas phage PhiPA3 TaxID=998086 RepID=F8SJH5_BPPA3|nr:hypothetical protein AVT69_gp337 [Pseudomonas phage PhiPA3]AEH03762.1 hypothetical protein [Pseudomonas phage PhiPA3]